MMFLYRLGYLVVGLAAATLGIFGPALAESPRTDLYGDPLPAGALARLGTVRFRNPNGWQTRVIFTPDSKFLIAKPETGGIPIWEAATGRLCGRIESDDFNINGLTLSPDGKTLIAGGMVLDKDRFPSHSAIRFWDITSRKELRTIKLGKDPYPLETLILSPDGKNLFFICNEFHLWDVETGTELLKYKFPKGVQTLAVSPNGKLLFAGGRDPWYYLWEWQTGQEPRKIKTAAGGIFSPTFSPDGQTLAACTGYPDVGVFLLDVVTGKSRRILAEHPGLKYLNTLAFSPDGKLLATGDRGRGQGREENWSGGVLLWEVATGLLLRDLKTPGESTRALAFSPNGRWLAAGTEWSAHVWDLGTGQEVAAIDGAHRSHVSTLAVSASGLIATAGEDHTVRLWDAATGRQQHKLQHRHWVRGVAISPDGRKIASSSLDDSVQLWDAVTGKAIYKLPGHGAFGGERALRFAPDGKRLFSYGDDGYLRGLDPATGRAFLEWKVRPEGVKVPDDDADKREQFFFDMRAAFSPDGKAFALCAGDHFHIFDALSGKEMHKIPNPGGHVISLALSSSGKHLLACGWGKPGLTKLPDGRVRSSSATNHPLSIWDLSSGRLVRQVLLPEGGAGPVAFRADCQIYAVAPGQPLDRIFLYDLARGQELRSFTNLGSPVRSLAFTPDGKRLLSGMDDTSVLILDVEGLR